MEQFSMVITITSQSYNIASYNSGNIKFLQCANNKTFAAPLIPETTVTEGLNGGDIFLKGAFWSKKSNNEDPTSQYKIGKFQRTVTTTN